MMPSNNNLYSYYVKYCTGIISYDTSKRTSVAASTTSRSTTEGNSTISYVHVVGRRPSDNKQLYSNRPRMIFFAHTVVRKNQVAKKYIGINSFYKNTERSDG